MDFFSVVNNRRTIRKFSPKPIEFEKLVDIVKAGMKAPSSGNLQNWRFILVLDKAKLRSLYDSSLEQEVFYTAQAGIVVCSNDSIAEQYYGLRGKRLYSIQNCAAAIQNMLLAATALGLGSCWVGAFDEDVVADVFSIPSGFRPQAILLFGYPAETPEPKHLKDLSRVLFFNSFGSTLRRPWEATGDYSVGLAKTVEKVKFNIKDKKRVNDYLKKSNPDKVEDELPKVSRKSVDLKKSWNSFLKKLKK